MLVKNAVASYKSAGRDAAAFAEFSKPHGKFNHFKKDLYIFVYDLKGTCVAIGSNPGMVGKNLFEMKDADGNPVIQNSSRLSERMVEAGMIINGVIPQQRRFKRKDAISRNRSFYHKQL